MKSASLQYATALADIALEQGAADPVKKQLADFGAAYAESGELRKVLANPAVERTVKHAVIEKLAARMAVDGAESLVAKQMTPAMQEAMINSFVQSLQGRPN